jgi:hypothetical protein
MGDCSYRKIFDTFTGLESIGSRINNIKKEISIFSKIKVSTNFVPGTMKVYAYRRQFDK